MRITFSPYQLVPRDRRSRPRQGALLRWDFEDGVRGYSDCHPWPEFGDLPVEGQLSALRQGESTSLLERSRRLARSDAEARSLGRSLFDGLTVPPSHASLPHALGPGTETPVSEEELDSLRERGFDRIKVKAGNAPQIEGEQIARIAPWLQERGFRLRIDLNEKLPYEAAHKFLACLRDGCGTLMWIDWIEDPCPYSPAEWTRLREEFGVRLAIDLALDESFFSPTPTPPPRERGSGVGVLVLKPAVTEPEAAFRLAVQEGWSVAVTSYLDHPVGQLGAAWVAANESSETGGLITHPVYVPNAFSSQLGVENARLVPPPGTGIGFDHELAALDWQDLV